jgi:hypothetical protein
VGLFSIFKRILMHKNMYYLDTRHNQALGPLILKSWRTALHYNIHEDSTKIVHRNKHEN